MSRIKEKLTSLRVGKSIKVGDGSITKSNNGYFYHSPRVGQLTLTLEQAVAFATNPIEEEAKILEALGTEVEVIDEGLEEWPEQLDLKFKKLDDTTSGIKQGELFTNAMPSISKQPKSDLSRYKGPK